MCVHNIVDVAGQAEREFGHGHQQSVAAACCGTLDIHGRAAGGLTQAAADIFAEFTEAFDQAEGGGGFSFAQRGRGNRRDFNELAVWLILQTVHDLDEVQLRGLTVGDDFIRQQAQLLPEIFDRGERLFRFFCDLPVLVDCRIERHMAVFVHVLAIFEFDCHRVFLLVFRDLSLPPEKNFFGAAHPSSAHSAPFDTKVSVRLHYSIRTDRSQYNLGKICEKSDAFLRFFRPFPPVHFRAQIAGPSHPRRCAPVPLQTRDRRDCRAAPW